MNLFQELSEFHGSKFSELLSRITGTDYPPDIKSFFEQLVLSIEKRVQDIESEDVTIRATALLSQWLALSQHPNLLKRCSLGQLAAALRYLISSLDGNDKSLIINKLNSLQHIAATNAFGYNSEIAALVGLAPASASPLISNRLNRFYPAKDLKPPIITTIHSILQFASLAAPRPPAM